MCAVGWLVRGGPKAFALSRGGNEGRGEEKGKPTNQVLRKGEGRGRRREWPSASVFERLATLGQGPGAETALGGGGRVGLVKTLTFVSHRVERGRKQARKWHEKKENGGSISSLSMMS